MVDELDKPITPDTNITERIKTLFELVSNGGSPLHRLGLFSCFVNGKPSAAIVIIKQNQNGNEDITPVFVYAHTDGLTLTDHDGEEPTHSGKTTKGDVVQ